MIVGLITFVAGAIFSIGLAVAGMTQPAKVVGFLDVTGQWDPSLAFVMGGALIPFALAYQYSRRKTRKPVFAHAYPVLQSKKLDKRLVAGAALFGLGWGLGGFCPGPALASFGAFSKAALVFVPSMLAGMALFHLWNHSRQMRER